MSILDGTQEVRSKITYQTCKDLGMRYIDTITPQYLWSVEYNLSHKNGRSIPVFGEFIRVIFDTVNDKVVVRYTKDHWDVRGRHWETLENLSGEELNLLVATLDNQFNKHK